MKIPESVRIAGVEYRIAIVPNLMHGATAAYGHIDYENSVIELSDTFGTEHQRMCQILLHEILHGIRENNGMRRYANFGNYNPIAACVVNYYYTILAEKLEKKEELDKKWNTNAVDVNISQ